MDNQLKYHCGAVGCQGHKKSNDVCWNYNFSNFGGAQRQQKYHCGESDCKGHTDPYEKCEEQESFFDSMKMPRRHFCDSPNCPGHFFPNEKCYEFKSIFNNDAYKSREPKIIRELESKPIHLKTDGLKNYQTFKILEDKPLNQRLTVTNKYNHLLNSTNQNVETPRAISKPGLSIDGKTFLIILLSLFFVSMILINLFGVERFFVAAQAFFLFSIIFTTSATRFGSKTGSQTTSNFISYMAIGAGIFVGLLAGYLVLTTPNGQMLTDYVIENTQRMLVSVFMSLFSIWVFEFLLRKIF